jgi:hypothetical protein
MQESWDSLLQLALSFAQSTYGDARLRDAAAEFCRWNPAYASLTQSHEKLFRAWFLFDWTPDANDPALPPGIRPEQTPMEVWTETQGQGHIPNPPHFSFYRFEPTDQSGRYQFTDLLTGEVLEGGWPVDSAPSQQSGIIYALIALGDINQGSQIIAHSPENFPSRFGEKILQFKKALSASPLSRADLRTYAVEIFDAYHSFRTS